MTSLWRERKAEEKHFSCLGARKNLCKTTFHRSTNWIMCFSARHTRRAIDANRRRFFVPFIKFIARYSDFAPRHETGRVMNNITDEKFRKLQKNNIAAWWSPCRVAWIITQGHDEKWAIYSALPLTRYTTSDLLISTERQFENRVSSKITKFFRF